MWVSRIRVTGGFLAGLDLALSPGLNVVVGPRGAGKTTLLELLRHALGAQHAEQGGSKRRQQFLDAVLGTGDVIVDVEAEDGGRHLVVDARGGGQRTDHSQAVLVLGQNELEEIASDAPSRLKLLDLRTGVAARLPDDGAAADLTRQIYDVRVELQSRREESQKRQRLAADRELFASQETALLGGDSGQLSEQREQLRVAEERVIQSNQDLEKIGSTLQDLTEIHHEQARQTDRLSDLVIRIESLPESTEPREKLGEALRLSNSVVQIFDEVSQILDQSAARSREQNLAAREAAAPIREALEEAETGLGQITAQLRNINTELRTLDENDAAIALLEGRHGDLGRRRDQILDTIETAEEELYEVRAKVARSTTAQIANNVVVVVDHLANYGDFRTFLQESLKGTNTRSAMVDSVAEKVLPRQLLELVELHDASSLAAIIDVPTDRAQRLIENLDRRETLAALAEIRLTDSVDFRLRDGAIDKSVDILSTGQKCAVTLPIVLSEQERTLILDQPEDHLDNAYLVRNVVRGFISRRQNGVQTIVATHNANIPVLGSADRVIVLSSDGQIGSVAASGAFDEDEIVKTITGLMEGGRDAFARRSAFYAEHGGLE